MLKKNLSNKPNFNFISYRTLNTKSSKNTKFNLNSWPRKRALLFYCLNVKYNVPLAQLYKWTRLDLENFLNNKCYTYKSSVGNVENELHIKTSSTAPLIKLNSQYKLVSFLKKVKDPLFTTSATGNILYPQERLKLSQQFLENKNFSSNFLESFFRKH